MTTPTECRSRPSAAAQPGAEHPDTDDKENAS
jgi:hypothetical protein